LKKIFSTQSDYDDLKRIIKNCIRFWVSLCVNYAQLTTALFNLKK
jgi:hypothetical protein